MRQFFTNNC